MGNAVKFTDAGGVTFKVTVVELVSVESTAIALVNEFQTKGRSPRVSLTNNSSFPQEYSEYFRPHIQLLTEISLAVSIQVSPGCLVTLPSLYFA